MELTQEQITQKMRALLNLFLIVSFVLLILIGIYLFAPSYNTIDGNGNNAIINSASEKIVIKNVSECENLTFYNQIVCIRDYIKPHYKYIVRSDIDRNITEVFENGGDCYDWSYTYVELAEQIGLNARVDFIFGKEYGHAYAVIWNDKLEGFCTMSGLELDCASLGGNS